MTQMLSFKDVELYYDHVYALKGVSIEMNEGETVALIGANGAGKSSILRAITGLRKIKSGEIEFMGERLDGTPAAEIVRKGIAMVPEGRRVFPYMSVRDNLLMGAFTRTDKAAIARTLDSVLERFPRLRERYGQQAGTLSGGEQQMMVIGRALMAAPRLSAAGRTQPGDRTETGAGHRPLNRCDQPRRGRVGTAGRAEFAHGAVDLEPRLCAFHGCCRPQRQVSRADGTTTGSRPPISAASFRAVSCAFW